MIDTPTPPGALLSDQARACRLEAVLQGVRVCVRRHQQRHGWSPDLADALALLNASLPASEGGRP